MALSVNQEEELATKEFIKIVNDIRVQHNAGPMSYNTGLKFMMARKFDIHRALALYEAHEITRFRESLAKFDIAKEPLKSELESGKFTVLSSRDSSGAAIAVFTACKHVPTETSHQTTLQGVVYQLDAALEDVETQRSGILFIYNMTGSKYSHFDYELSQKILSLLKGAYPARLKKVLIVMAPLWFKAPFKILRLFVREKLRDRVFMLSVSQLPVHVSLTSLPKELGGTYVGDHLAWLAKCKSGTASNLGDLCDLASHNNLHLLSSSQGNGEIRTNHNSASSPSSESNPNGQVSDEEHGDSEEPSNQNCEKALKPIAKPKPQKIIMPTNDEIEHDKSSQLNESLNLLGDTLMWEDDSMGMNLEEFIQYLKSKGRRGLYEEYNEIKLQGADGAFDSSRLKPNQSKNRYTDVLCYDHSRVKLSVLDEDECSDYVNANYVDGYKQLNAFISTQGPLPRTFVDFWRMIWEQEVLVIVMTTRTIERCRTKCGQYWPLHEETTEEYEYYQVFNSGIEQFKDYIITHLVLCDKTTGASREVTHMQFSSWPDYGVPLSALAMLDFRDKVRDQQAKGVEDMGIRWKGHPQGPPIVVHCSAGIGRTGTFITLDISILRLEATGKIDIKRVVEKIRRQRAYSIQMPDQYVFCFLALLEFALSRGLLQDVDLSGFEESESDLEE